jgi:hypothetical protein
MKPTRTLIAAIKKARPPHADETNWIADQLDVVRSLGSDIAENHRLRQEAERAFADKIAKLDKRLEGIRDNCPHYTTTYYPDAAGGSDSWTECDTCGRDLGK